MSLMSGDRERLNMTRIRPQKICIVCGEYKEHYAYGKCRNCYRRECRIKKPSNTKSGTYLGCNVAEKVLSKVFDNVEVMKPNNPGFDFVCNKGKKIDVKSSCMRKNGNGWTFRIKKNTVADFFLCIAFDNRKSLMPLHLWLIPSSKVKDKVSMGIRPSMTHKWDDFKLDISKTLQCCDQMKR